METEKLYYEDIICARSTPPGASAIAVVRVSGKNSWQLLSKIFKSGINTKNYKSHRVYYGKIIDEDQIIDDVIALTFEEGKSFTGEESFEINCHGSEIIVSLLTKTLLKHGARLAEGGEFSKRAFLNGKVDLSEAEAIMDIVNASTSKSALLAVRQLTGTVTNEVNDLKNKLSDLMAAIEVYIDYPDEDLSLDTGIWENKTKSLIQDINNLLQGFKRGKFLREGVTASLLGKTNAGKSTMFNFLINEDKAIVSDIHGTTRDYIDGVINIEGYGVRLYDTAGLRETNDPIEKEGTKRAIELSDKSDIILYMLPSDEGFTDEDKENISSIEKDKKLIVVINKIDLTDDEGSSLYNTVNSFLESDFTNYKIVKVSALEKKGITEFNQNFIELLTHQKVTEGSDPVITNERHANLLEQATENLFNASERLQEQILDLAAFELRESLDRLGEITGEVTPDDILGKIFSSFCVGK